MQTGGFGAPANWPVPAARRPNLLALHQLSAPALAESGRIPALDRPAFCRHPGIKMAWERRVEIR